MQKMGVWDKAKDLARDVAEDAKAERQKQKQADAAILMKLGVGVSEIVLFPDRIEFTDSVGFSRDRRTIHYNQITSTSLAGKHSKGAAVLTGGMSLIGEGKKTLTITTSGRTHEWDFRMETKKNLQRAYEIIQERIAAARQPQPPMPTSPPPMPPPVAESPTSSLAQELKELADLRDQGIITVEDFEAKKKQILGL